MKINWIRLLISLVPLSIFIGISVAPGENLPAYMQAGGSLFMMGIFIIVLAFSFELTPPDKKLEE